MEKMHILPLFCLIHPSRPTKKRVFLKPHCPEPRPPRYSFPPQSTLTKYGRRKRFCREESRSDTKLLYLTAGKEPPQDDSIGSLAIKTNGKCRTRGEAEHGCKKCLRPLRAEVRELFPGGLLSKKAEETVRAEQIDVPLGARFHPSCGSDDPFAYSGPKVCSHHVDRKLLEKEDFKHSPDIYSAPTTHLVLSTTLL